MNPQMKSTVFIVGETEEGLRWVYELSGAHMQIENQEPWGFMHGPYVRSLPPLMTVEGVMVEGRMWKPEETFTPSQQSLEPILGEIEP